MRRPKAPEPAVTAEKPVSARTPTLDSLKATVYAADPACLCDPELFTGPVGVEPEDEPADEKAARLDAARDICAACPVRVACLAYALRTRPTAGVWAGLTTDELALASAAARHPVKAISARLALREVA